MGIDGLIGLLALFILVALEQCRKVHSKGGIFSLPVDWKIWERIMESD